MRLTEMRPSHLMLVSLRASEKDMEEVAALGLDMEFWAMSRAQAKGLNFTILDENEMPVACFGLLDDGPPGVVTAWGVRDPRAPALGLKLGKRVFREMLRTGGYRRVQAQARELNAPAVRLIEWLGFKYEGRKDNYFLDGSAMLEYVICAQ